MVQIGLHFMSPLALTTFGPHDGAVGALLPGDDNAAAATALLDEAVLGRQGANDDGLPTSSIIATPVPVATTASAAPIILLDLDGSATAAPAAVPTTVPTTVPTAALVAISSIIAATPVLSRGQTRAGQDRSQRERDEFHHVMLLLGWNPNVGGA
jgi:hypothetical protein